jgi:hypothetical protein
LIQLARLRVPGRARFFQTLNTQEIFMAFEIKREIKRENVDIKKEDVTVTLSAMEDRRIQAALDALAVDQHAPREISVKLTLHIHHEYPKHVQAGGNTVVVNNPDEESATSAGSKLPSRRGGVESPQGQEAATSAGGTMGIATSPGSKLPSRRGGVESPDGPELVGDSSEPENQSQSGDFAEMSKAERKEELGGMSKSELRELAEQHDVHTDSGMNKGKITSAINKQLNKEAKTEAKTGTE